jgi:tRNA pseudouridine38-40 synthase
LYLLEDRISSAIFHGKVGVHYIPMDLDLMARAGKYLIGKQDFSAFRASDCQANSPVRNLTYFNVTKTNNLFCFEFTANAFLYHMIRNIVGALIYVGNGKLSVEGFHELILSKNRVKAPPTFMPDGLYLSHVMYEGNYFSYQPSLCYL